MNSLARGAPRVRGNAKSGAMARRGDTIENPATGERITFLDVAAETGGDLLRFELSMPPGACVPVAHFHPHQEERFELVAGSARFRVGREVLRAGAGDLVVVPAGVSHRFWNDRAEELRVVVSFRPALRTESFFERLWSGKLTRRGLPGMRLLLDMAPENYLEEVCIAGIPVAAQRVGQRLLAAVAQFLR